MKTTNKRARDSIESTPLVVRKPSGTEPISNKDSGIELRGCVRSSLEVEVSLGSESQFFNGMAKNMSSGGVFVATYRSLPAGSRLDLQISLPDGPLRVAGVVRWRREASNDVSPGLGIAFEDLDADALARVEQFCHWREPLYYDDE